MSNCYYTFDKMSPSLKYTPLVRKKLTDFPQMTQQSEIKGIGKIQTEARKLLKTMVINGFHQWDKGHSFAYKSFDTQSFCEFSGGSSYQGLENISQFFEDIFTAYRNSEKIDSLFYETCIKVHGTSPHPISIEEIDNALPIRAD